ncbi:MAG: TonB-dependent siderophore receptor [Aphanocapsa sp. GSE-SYN-MK-11-07L]|jgi:iron complex outermembrane receptor protein|nr:TonB-dependent siderophore receptor [Aphanocapsa sp. GSE-SYN-MK-11-07L]
MAIWQRLLVLTTGFFSILRVSAVAAEVPPNLSFCQAEECYQQDQLQPVRESQVVRLPTLPEVISPKAATTVQEWIAQIEATTVQVTDIQLSSTETSLEILLETQDGKSLQIDASKFRTEGNSLVADIPNAVLTLPNAQAFTAENPTPDIATVQVVQQDANTIRVSVTGKNTLPTTEVTLQTGELAYSLNPAADEPEEEIVVTGQQDTGYFVPDTSLATRTDTPLRDIPQSIQIVPQEVLREQQAYRLDDALRNVAGVTPEFSAGAAVYYKIRGFGVSNNNVLRDGLPDPGVGDSVELAGVERIEVLKGPASVLFGLGNPGGSINIVTKPPLSEPFYGIDATVGSYRFYRGAVDLSGPLDDSKTALYRLNVAYRNSGSFVDFYNSQSFGLSPVVSLAIGQKTKLTLGVDYIESRDDGIGFGLPTVGTIFANPNGKLPRNRNLTEPTDQIEGTTVRAGYKLEHKFNDYWSLTNAFRYGFRSYYAEQTRPAILDADNRTMSRTFELYDQNFTNYTLTTNVVGRFSTGSIQHQLLLGVDLYRFTLATPRYASGDAASIDIFNPIYGQPAGAFTFESSDVSITDSLGIYLQDQISITKNVKLLLGGRFDVVEQRNEDFLTGTQSSQSDSAFSPRIGIVYQPIRAISLYASYISSFTPTSGSSANPETVFDPERGNQYEVGVKADLNDRIFATLALYDLTRTNVLVTDPDDQDFQIQTGEQKSRGIELSLTGEILPGWNILAGYAYTNARISKDTTFDIGSRLENVPNHAFNLWTTYEIQKGNLKGLGFGLGLFFVGDRAGDLPNTYDVPSYLRTDATVFYKRDKFRIGLNLENLFDVEYFEFGYFGSRVEYGQPFSVQGTISWEF